jgi:hypothetical protein
MAVGGGGAAKVQDVSYDRLDTCGLLERFLSLPQKIALRGVKAALR